MTRKNRYAGVLKPLPQGRGAPEVSIVLERIQFSAFFGKLNRNRRQELALKLQKELGDRSGRPRIIPVCEQDLKDMWVLEQYRRDADQPESEGDACAAQIPRLKGGGPWTCFPSLRIIAMPRDEDLSHYNYYFSSLSPQSIFCLKTLP